MRCNLLFKGIHEKENEKWEDISMVLAKLINQKLDLPDFFEEIDMQIISAHVAAVMNKGSLTKCRNHELLLCNLSTGILLREIRSSIIYLNV